MYVYVSFYDFSVQILYQKLSIQIFWRQPKAWKTAKSVYSNLSHYSQILCVKQVWRAEINHEMTIPKHC